MLSHVCRYRTGTLDIYPFEIKYIPQDTRYSRYLPYRYRTYFTLLVFLKCRSCGKLQNKRILTLEPWRGASNLR